MHFCQFTHRNHFTLRMNHKPLEWLAIVFNAYGWRGCWIDMLQDFNFKILHQPKSKHSNVDTINVATLAFGLRPRQGGCEVAGLEVDPGVTSHAPGSAKSTKSVRE